MFGVVSSYGVAVKGFALGVSIGIGIMLLVDRTALGRRG